MNKTIKFLIDLIICLGFSLLFFSVTNFFALIATEGRVGELSNFLIYAVIATVFLAIGFIIRKKIVNPTRVYVYLLIGAGLYLIYYYGANFYYTHHYSLQTLDFF